MPITTLKLDGRLDTARVGQIETGFAARAGALSRPGDAAVIDLSDVTYIASLGIRLLVTTLKQFNARGVRFATVRPESALVLDTLKVAGLEDHLNLVGSIAEAEAKLGA